MENDHEGTTTGSPLPDPERQTLGSGDSSSVASKTKSVSTQELIHDTITKYAAENLGFRLSSLGYDDSLFDLGIDSMGVAEISAAIEEQTGKRLVAMVALLSVLLVPIFSFILDTSSSLLYHS